jgi:hypothetical protein
MNVPFDAGTQSVQQLCSRVEGQCIRHFELFFFMFGRLQSERCSISFYISFRYDRKIGWYSIIYLFFRCDRRSPARPDTSENRTTFTS